MNWGYKIAISFVIFIGIIVTMVVISMNQDISLVSADYYEQELAYQDQIDRMERTRKLEKQPEIILDRNSGVITIDVFDSTVDSGEILFFRPSDASMDKRVSFPASGKLNIAVNDWEQGLWKVKLSWSVAGDDFYLEEIVNL
ncbi:FixH family protein [Fulvivirga sedimenti]|uniref:FixH family protein n=1 Tax=Fulvivirga sedimenti TaxID=2879465 RepID=A0A9X1HME4_9BACT|nr:FixH family protein [Fulvivirga sedimenti]MCA6073257.1 FixH family protein [Fulvivirga sedimenti]